MNRRFIGEFVVDLTSARDGGMGSVYRGINYSTGEPAAIKFVAESRRDSQLHMLALQREVDSLQALRHPNIVRFIDAGNDDDMGRYVVTEWLEEDLQARASKEPIRNWDDFWLLIGKPVLDALCFAFAKNVVHRDLKPSNIMFNSDGVPKLIDFGISGFIERIQLGATLAGQKSEIYSPPEDNPDNSTRDVYGFAATAIYAATGTSFADRDELITSLESIGWPEKVVQILFDCLEAHAGARPDNVIVLKDKLERAIPRAEGRAAKWPTVFIKFTTRADAEARHKFGFASTAAVLQELLSESIIVEKSRLSDYPGQRLVFVTPEVSFVAALDDKSPDFLIITKLFETRPAHWVFLQDRGFRPEISLRDGSGIGRSEQSSSAIHEVFRALDEHEYEKAQQFGDTIFDVWRTVLRGRADVCSNRYPTLDAISFRVDGARIIATLRDAPDFGLVGLYYFIDDGLSRVAVGEVESVSDEELVLYATAAFDPAAIPTQGRLYYNAAGTEKAIRHQELALDRIQSGDAPLSALAAFINDASSVPPPVADPYTPILDNIDDHKQFAAQSALGSKSIFLVVGPPGTGKTELITELVLQETKRDPSIRILVSGQTHMAVDNVLERVRKANPDLNCVRLGRSSERIAAQSFDLLLENVAAEWSKKAAAKCRVAMDEYGARAGVQVSEIRARQAVREVFVANSSLDAAKHAYAQAAAKRYGMHDGVTDESRISVDTLSEIDDELLATKELIASAGFRLADAEQRMTDEGILALQMHAKGPEALAESEKFAPDAVLSTLEVTSAWLQRLSNTREFFPAILSDAQVVAGTCLGFLGVTGASETLYDLAIIDEASRALPTEVLVPASRAKRIVLVGDRHQLPPFIESELLEVEWLEANGLTRDEVAETLFARFEAHLPMSSQARLRTQYRMRKEIGDLVGSVFYPGQLDTAKGAGERVVSLTDLGLGRNVQFLSTSSRHDREEKEEGSGFTNLLEVRVIQQQLQKIIAGARKGRKRIEVVVLTPYVAQRATIEQMVSNLRGQSGQVIIRVHTVHTFQGREADIALYSCVRSNTESELGFTNDPRLLNVALSRARGGLMVIGDAEFLRKFSGKSRYREVIAHIQQDQSCVLRGVGDV